jgi:hypothetical protein
MKGEKTNKATELLFELSLRDDFKYEIQVLRLKYGIPKNGFQNKLKRAEWIERPDAIDFWDLMLKTMEKYKIPTSYLVPFQEYIEFGKFNTKTKQLNFVGFIDRYAHRKDMDQGNIEDWYIAKKEPFVKIILLGRTSKADVHDFINQNWETIETVLAEQGDYPKSRVKKKTYKDRDQKIIELSKKSNNELRKIIGTGYQGLNLKENLIQHLMQTKEYGNCVVSDGYIKKVINKYKIKRSK